jgi:hypothetical protein
MLYLDISNQELAERILLLRDRERAITVKFLNHLGEFDKRRLYLDLGYSSLFDYCVRKLGYSESSAFRRVECARALREFPQLGSMILNGEVNLCSLATAARKLSEGKIVLADINGKSRREVEGLIAGLNPGHKPKEKIRQISVRVASEPMVNEFNKSLSASNSLSRTEPALNLSPELISENSLSPVKVKFDAVAEGVFSNINPQSEEAGLLSPVKVKSETRSETRLEIKFSLSEESFKKLEEVKAALSNKLGAGASVEDIFNELMDKCLKGARPKTEPIELNKGVKSDSRPSVKIIRRHIPRAVRREVMLRDTYSCSYVSADGTRCGAKAHLHLDHIQPYSMGGAHSRDNLRVLCRSHNLGRNKGF